MKHFLCAVLGLLLGIPLAARSEPTETPAVCLPNRAIVGSQADSPVRLVTPGADVRAVKPVAVEVLISEDRCVAVTATYLSSHIAYAQVKDALARLLGRQPDSDNVNVASWKGRETDDLQLTASVSYQAKRIKVTFAEHPREDPSPEKR